MTRTSTAEAIFAFAAEMREENAQLATWFQQSLERQEQQTQATIAVAGEISKGQERLQRGQERIAKGQDQTVQEQGQIDQVQERIAQIVANGTKTLAAIVLESQALTARMLALTHDIHIRITGGGSGTTH